MTGISSVGADLVRGAKSIGAEIGVGPRKAYHLLENGLLPASKESGKWIASREALRDHYARLTRGAK
jgi:hypothetical protein